VWAEYAETAGDTFAEDKANGLPCCLPGSGSDKEGLYRPLVTGGIAVDGAIGGIQFMEGLYIGGIVRAGTDVGTLEPNG
jgi:hypothetical protein